jgi:hypothetical protein
LEQTIQSKSLDLAKAPDGTLRIDQSSGIPRFYLRLNPKDTTGKYIARSAGELPALLAQKKYDQIVLKTAEKELLALREYERILQESAMERIYEGLDPVRKSLVTPIIPTTDDFVRDWLNVSYEGKAFPEDSPGFFTDKGELVRSKTEVILSNHFEKHNIPYRYEYPIVLDGITFYPDYFLLNVRTRKEYIWDHFGMMDDPAYLENALRKIEIYERNGIFPGDKLIITFETAGKPLDTRIVDLLIRKHLI